MLGVTLPQNILVDPLFEKSRSMATCGQSESKFVQFSNLGNLSRNDYNETPRKDISCQFANSSEIFDISINQEFEPVIGVLFCEVVLSMRRASPLPRAGKES